MRGGYLVLGAAILAAGLAGFHLIQTGPDAKGGRHAQPPASAFPFPALPPQAPSAGPDDAAALAAWTTRDVNPLERAPDLRAVYSRYRDGHTALERHLAMRAWGACFPAFAAPAGIAPSLENATRGLAPQDPHYAERIEAYRNLLGRCKNFFDLSRDDILAQTQHWQAEGEHGAARAPGELVLQKQEDGDSVGALALARRIAASRDPYAIASLGAFAGRYAADQAHASPAGSEERQGASALAFSLAACQLGLDCGPDSLTALQLCASTGACSGDLVQRYLEEVPPAERDAAIAESRRIAAAIQSGDLRALGW